MASYGAADASVVDQTLKKFQILTKKPELFLSRRDDIGEEFVKLTKSLYDLSKTIEKSALLESSKSRFSSALLSLITDGFDDEQIWQQIELENTACQPQLVKRISRLATRAKQSETFVDADEEIEEDHVNDDEEIEEEDDDDDGGEEEEEDDIDDIKVDSEGESEPGSDMEQLQFSGDDSSDKSGDEEFWKLDKSTSTKKRPRPFDDLEENDIETDHPVARKRPKNSVVDDKFFRLADLEAFLNMEDSKMMESQEKSTKNYETNTDDDEDDDNESIDYFQDMQSSGNESNDDDDQSMDEESEVKLGKTSTRYRYDDFFDAMPEDGDNRDYNESNDRFMDDEDRRKPLDLFDNMDDDGEKLMDDESKSTIEKRQEKIKQKIQALEESNLAEKPWQLKGEATSYTRPENSLLQETAAFDHTQRLAPVITEETTMKLEDIIQRRIRDHAWDDVERKIKPKEEPFEYKKRIVLDQEKSKLSLAQVYELEYLKHQQKEKPEEELAEHKTIKAMMTSLFTKLDALSNFHFTPKPPAPEVKIVSNLPSVTVEEVAPVTATTSSLLAPGEIMDPKAARLDKGDREKTKTDRLRERRLKKQHQSKRRKMREEREKLGGQTNPKMNKDKMLKKLVNDVEKDEAKSNTKLSSSKTVFGRLNEMQATKTTKKPNKQKEKHNYKS